MFGGTFLSRDLEGQNRKLVVSGAPVLTHRHWKWVSKCVDEIGIACLLNAPSSSFARSLVMASSVVVAFPALPPAPCRPSRIRARRDPPLAADAMAVSRLDNTAEEGC